MGKWMLVLFIVLTCSLVSAVSYGQCSICTRTAEQLGEKPARSLNAGILYLAFAPFAIGGYIYYRWRKSDASS